jgi:ADP-ribosylglycohydrolase/rhodanese-related sulfurtransferase
MIRTSESDPLRLDAVTVPTGGRIGLTLCPGKKQRNSMSGQWDRNLEADLEAVCAFDSVALVTLMEAHELAGVEVPVERLGPAVDALGMEWFHLPIVDANVPDAAFETAWRYAGARLREHLGRDRNIVVHCRGGLGRSGTIAARLLVELGVSAREAIRSVRAARPGAIETSAQERYVASVELPDRRADRIAGCLLAGAIGDALGRPVEFSPLDMIREQYGEDGIRDLVPIAGRTGLVTDDTQMTLFTAEGLTRGFRHTPGLLPDLTREVWQAYRRWLITQGIDNDTARVGRLLDVPELHESRAPGHTCITALESGAMGGPDSPVNDSKGCGGVMRVAPVGLVRDRLRSLDEVFALGAATAAITHGHPSGYLSSGVQAVLVALLLEGVELDPALDCGIALLVRERDHEETLDALTRARTLASRGRPTPEALEDLGGAWVGEEALAISVCAALACDDLEEAVLLAVNHGGDSDSTGAITGNLMGARHGAGAIPARWAQRVEFRDLLLDFAGQIDECGGRPC